MEANVLENEKIIIKGFGKDVVKAVVLSAIISITASIGTYIAFYYNTTNSISNITENDIKQDKIITDFSEAVVQMNEKWSSTNTVTAVSDEKVKGLENQITQLSEQMKIIQQTQLDILKSLGEIKRK